MFLNILLQMGHILYAISNFLDRYSDIENLNEAHEKSHLTIKIIKDDQTIKLIFNSASLTGGKNKWIVTDGTKIAASLIFLKKEVDHLKSKP